jgi:membrane-associated phospholipid phosphatase
VSTAKPAEAAHAARALTAFATLSLAAAVTLAPADARASEPAYALHAEIDAPVLAVGAVFQLSWLMRGQLAAPYCAPQCDPGKLDALDRGVAGRYSAGWNRASDIGIATLLVSELGVLAGVDGVGPGLNDAVVVAEAVVWANALGTIANYSMRRPRPFAYGDAAPLELRTDGNAGMSFFSGHTATAFAATTAVFVTLHRLQPKSPLPWIVLAVGGLGSAFVSTSRMLAGYHFPTDVLAGATVGVSLGFLVPALHGAPVSLAPLPDASGRTSGLSVSARF